jgi:hypothetical protein
LFGREPPAGVEQGAKTILQSMTILQSIAALAAF